MSKALDVDTYHKYLVFLANEVTRVIQAGAGDDDVVRLTAEFNAFKQRCLESDLPEEIRSHIGKIHVNYTSRAVGRSTWLIIGGIMTVGIAALVLYSIRKRERKDLLRDLKTHLEALAMRTKMRY
jgi:hypothetical protein